MVDRVGCPSDASSSEGARAPRSAALLDELKHREKQPLCFNRQCLRCRAADALAVLQQQLDEWQRAMSPCKVHGPDLWEGDGTCVPCEGQRLRDERDALQQQLDAVVLHRDDALRRVDALRAAREALRDFGQHRSSCGVFKTTWEGREPSGRPCDCGLIAAIAAAPEKGGQ